MRARFLIFLLAIFCSYLPLQAQQSLSSANAAPSEKPELDYIENEWPKLLKEYPEKEDSLRLVLQQYIQSTYPYGITTYFFPEYSLFHVLHLTVINGIEETHIYRQLWGCGIFSFVDDRPILEERYAKDLKYYESKYPINQ